MTSSASSLNYGFGYSPPETKKPVQVQPSTISLNNTYNTTANNNDSGFDSNSPSLLQHSTNFANNTSISPSTIQQFQGFGGYSATALSSVQHLSALRDKCLRCNNQVYALERIGPIKGNIYHKICFKCLICDRQLDLKTYYTNQINLEDRQIYCRSHAPKSGKGVFGADNIYIQNILNAPKLDVMQKVENKPKVSLKFFYIIN